MSGNKVLNPKRSTHQDEKLENLMHRSAQQNLDGETVFNGRFQWSFTAF